MKDLKEALGNSSKPDITHVRTPLLNYIARACEYGDSKYQRGNYLRPVGGTKEDFERLRGYLRATMSHVLLTLDSMEKHLATDPHLEDEDGMRTAAYAPDLESGLPHLAHAGASIMMAITQACVYGLLPTDPGRPWEDSTGLSEECLEAIDEVLGYYEGFEQRERQEGWLDMLPDRIAKMPGESDREARVRIKAILDIQDDEDVDPWVESPASEELDEVLKRGYQDAPECVPCAETFEVSSKYHTCESFTVTVDGEHIAIPEVVTPRTILESADLNPAERYLIGKTNNSTISYKDRLDEGFKVFSEDQVFLTGKLGTL